MLKKHATSRYPRSGLSLVELVVSMGLLALIMMPVISLMATSYKVYSASSASRDGTYLRQVALDAATLRLQDAKEVVDADRNFVDVRLFSGSTARLAYAGGQLVWQEAGVTQVLVQDLSNASFSVGAAGRAGDAAGDLLLLEVASLLPGEPSDSWSSTQIWIKPTI